MSALSPRLRGGRAARRPANGTQIALVLLAVSALAAFTPGARLVELAYPLATLAVTVRLLAQGRTGDALELNLWTWATAAGLRRLVDWSTGQFDQASPILVTASLGALLLGVNALRSGERWPVGFAYGFLVVAGGAAAASALGVVIHGLVPSLVSSILWFGPLALGVVLLSAGNGLADLIPVVLRFARWALLLLGLYALFQWTTAPAWDVFWLTQVAPNAEQLGSPFGRPEPFGLRPWGLSNSPYAFAHLLVLLLVTQVGTGTGSAKVVWSAVPMGVLALGLTGIRAAWLTTALVVLVLVATRALKLGRLAAIGMVAAFVALNLVPAVGDQIAGRLGTLERVGQDVSFLARLETYAQALPPFLGDPVGAGMGATGSGARANPQDQQGFQVLDSSYLDVLRTTGALIGVAVLAALLAMSLGAWVRGRRHPAPFPAWGALALVAPVDMLLGIVTSGPPAVVTWLVIGACAGAGRAPSSADPPGTSRSGQRFVPPATRHRPVPWPSAREGR